VVGEAPDFLPSLGLAIGGGIGVYGAELLPGDLSSVGKIAGVGLVAMGAYGIYKVIAGGVQPKTERHDVPLSEIPQLGDVSGKIIMPGKDGAAKLSTVWSHIFKTQRTYPIAFVIRNPKRKKLTVLVQFSVDEFPRPAWAGETRQSVEPYIVEFKPDKDDVIQEQVIINSYQPFATGFLGAAIMVDAVAKLTVDLQDGREQILDTTSFTIG
jgi:hypothetical protein